MPNRYRRGNQPGTSVRADRDFSRKGPRYVGPRVPMDHMDCSSAQMVFDELSYLYSVPNDNDYLVANLGCFKGHSATAFALSMKCRNLTGRVYTVDLYEDKRKGVKGVRGRRAHAERLFARYKVKDYIEICQGTTEEWSSKLSDLRFKFLFIDADHSHEGCSQDFDCWNTKVAVGGYIAFHDCHLNSVNQVIEEISSDWDLVAHYGLIKTFKRKGE